MNKPIKIKMLKDIIFVEPLENYQLFLRFEDGVEGIVSIAEHIEFTGVFAPLKEQTFFANVQVNPELGTIQWQNGADLDPDVLYSKISYQTIPDYNFPNFVTT